MADSDRTASLMTPAKLAQIRPKAAASPAAWLSQMAADAGHQHVHRLRELRAQLQAQTAQADLSATASELGRLAQALRSLDFGLLQGRGWWARATGRSRSAGANFAARFEQIDQVAGGLAARIGELHKQLHERSAPADRMVVELEVEYHAVDQIIDQGTRWLQDMRNQLKTRGAPADPAAQDLAKQDAQRCEILVARLKSLRAVSSAAQQFHQQAQAAAARRGALVRLLRQEVAGGIKSWQTRLAAVAAAARAGGAAGQDLDAAMEAHRDLQLCVKQAIADCGQLQAQEKVVADSLAALAGQLEAA